MDTVFTRERRYTADHEWVDFYERAARTGIGRFKLTGFREIQRFSFRGGTGFRKAGEVLALITYKDYRIAAHMPVDGIVITMNGQLLSEPRQLLEDPLGKGWIAEIAPRASTDALLLLPEAQYNQKFKKQEWNRIGESV